MVVEEIKGLSPKQLKQMQSVIALLHCLGVTDKQIELIPQVLSNWETVVKNMNAYTSDLANIKRRVETLEQYADEPKGMDVSADTSGNIRKGAGIGSDVERVLFGAGGFKER